jgi:hypothetical protein
MVTKCYDEFVLAEMSHHEHSWDGYVRNIKVLISFFSFHHGLMSGHNTASSAGLNQRCAWSGSR